MNALAGVVVELGEALLHKYGGQAAAVDEKVRAAYAEIVQPILDKLETLEDDIKARLAELGMLLATSAAADAAAGVVKAFEPKGTLPNLFDGAEVKEVQAIEDWDDVKTPTPEGDPKP